MLLQRVRQPHHLFSLLPPIVVVFFLMIPRPPGSTLFPYTTLFRSLSQRGPHLLLRFGGDLLGGGARLGEVRSEEPSELQSPDHLVCRLLLEKKNRNSRSFPPAAG